jgi:glutathione S-transferase
MATNTLCILKPSVNNLSTRIFVRAAGLDFEELDVWGKKSTSEFLAKDPADLTPLLEEAGLPRGSLWESCAIMQYLSNKHGLESLYPTDPGERRDGRQRDVLPDRDALSARRAATYSALGFGQYPGEVGSGDFDDETKEAARQAAEDAIAGPLEVYRVWFLGDGQLIGGDRPSIADIRFAATLEFLLAIDYAFPAWAEEYMQRMETTLGDAYSEPVADVRGYIDYVRSQSD